MNKYYTRACNFYYGKISQEKIKNKTALPIGSNSFLSFDCLEIISRKSTIKLNIKQLNKIPKSLIQKVELDIKNIIGSKCKL